MYYTYTKLYSDIIFGPSEYISRDDDATDNSLVFRFGFRVNFIGNSGVQP